MNAGPVRQSRRSGGAPRLGQRGSLQRLASAQGGGLFVALVIMSLYFSTATDSFFTRSNILVVLEQVSVLGMVAVPGAMLLVSGNLDLSVGSVAGLSAAVFGEFDKIFGWPMWLSVIGALAVGAAWGAGNGFLISYLGFSPVIVTLGGFAGAAGLAQTITSDNTRSGFGSAFDFLGDGTLAGIPVPVIIFFAVFLVGVYVWYETATGRHLIAIGANKDAATALGVASKRLPFVIYVLSGTAAALGGLIITAQLDGASVQIGVGLELQVLTAILLGGVAFNGGRGSLWGTLAGILFIGVLDDGLILINVGPYVADLAVGGALVVAAALDVLYQRLERIPVPESAEAEALETDRPAGPVPGGAGADGAGVAAGAGADGAGAGGTATPVAAADPGGVAGEGQGGSGGVDSAAGPVGPALRATGAGGPSVPPVGGPPGGGPPEGGRTDRAGRNGQPVPALEVSDITKRFGPVVALRGVSLSLDGGEVLGLVGDNGAGKSTLISIISGVARPDSGEIRVDGKPWAETGARTVREAGIETVFQNLALVPTLSIAENMYLGRELYGPGQLASAARRIDKRRMRREVEAAFSRLGLRMPPVTAKAGALSGGQRQAVAVARAVLWGSRVVIMDEPAAALGVQQTEAVLALIDRLKAEGVATLLVSHNMEHVLRVADRVAVFRLGRKIADIDRRQRAVTGMELVGLITGATSASS
jgi:ribose/xylose/arabinose/galactoside ABC-type transport system permease subunit/ABC-type branched-subunit amino acid transport system ATPase component